MKEFLSRAGVPFEVRNVELDLEAYRDLIARGFRTVPMTFVNTDPPVAIRGFDQRALEQALSVT